MRLALAALAAALLVGCAQFRELPRQDQLSLVVDVITLRVDRTTALVTKGVMTKAEGQKRLELAVQAANALQSAQSVIVACEGAAGKCDLAKVRKELGGAALDRLEEHLIKSGDLEQAEVIGAARIVYTLMQGSATPGTGETYSNILAPLIARFEASVGRLRAAVA